MGEPVGDFILEIPHVKQRYSWDCGLACVLMVLPSDLSQLFAEKFDTICKEEGFGNSTWSIDLAYLLKRFGIKHRYLTVTLGVDPGLSSVQFYSEILCKDNLRIANRFRDSSLHQVTVERGSVSTTQLFCHLRHHGPAILLTNAHLLSCTHCPGPASCGSVFPQLQRWLLPCGVTTQSSFQGHYIVLVGVEDNAHTVLYRNPSLEDHICRMPTETLETARRSYGTDEDVVFVYTMTSDDITGN